MLNISPFGIKDKVNTDKYRSFGLFAKKEPSKKLSKLLVITAGSLILLSFLFPHSLKLIFQNPYEACEKSKGLIARYKLIGQIILGVFIALMLYNDMLIQYFIIMMNS